MPIGVGHLLVSFLKHCIRNFMKILYLHQYFATPQSNAGTRSYEMAKRLVAKGHLVTFITSSAFLSEEYRFKRGWNKINIDSLTLHVLHLPYSNKDQFFTRIFKFILFSVRSTFKALSLRSDVVLATSTPLTIAIPGLIYSKIKRVPLVFEVRDLWPELPIAIGVIKNPIIKMLAQWLEKYTYKHSKRVIGLSPSICDGIIERGGEKNNVILASNSCDTELFDVRDNVGEIFKIKQLQFLKNRKLVVYTGTFGKINGVGYLAEVASAMLKIDSSICFLVIGDGMEKQSIIKRAMALEVLNKNFYVLPPAPKTEIVKLLSAADMSISVFKNIPEMWKNSANKFFDSLASLTPIAINYQGWQAEIIQKYQCGLVLEATDYTKAASQLSTFLDDHDGYEFAREKCKFLAYNLFSRDIMAENMLRALKEATDG